MKAPSTFQERIKFIREDFYKLSQEKMAEDIFGISRPTLCEYEKGKSSPNLDTIIMIGNKLKRDIPNFDIGYLLELSDNMQFEHEQVGEALGISDPTIKILKTVKDTKLTNTIESLIQTDNFMGLLGSINNIFTKAAVVKERTDEEWHDIYEYSKWLLESEIKVCAESILNSNMQSLQYLRNLQNKLKVKREKFNNLVK